jgi:hypothetical protein
MATAPQVQTAGTLSAKDDCSRWLDWNAKPTEEARKLLMLVGRNGDTIESIRDLIAVPPEIERTMRLFVLQHPEESGGVERVLAFRRDVAEEFERLAAESCGATPLEEAATCGRSICSVGLTEVSK